MPRLRVLKRVFQLTLKPDLGNSSVGRLTSISYQAKTFLYPSILIILIICFWQISVDTNALPSFLIPSPSSIILALIHSSNVIFNSTLQTLYESTLGLWIGVVSGYLIAILMDRFILFRLSLLPIISATQIIPVVAIAPIVILVLGFGAAPKIFLVSLMTFFPIAISCFGAFSSQAKENIEMSKSVGAGYVKTLIFVKIPQSATAFFDSLKISVTYAFGGAVIAEWLGGDIGLGTCMSRYRKSFQYDEMFACVIVIIVITLLSIFVVRIIERRICKWK